MIKMLLVKLGLSLLCGFLGTWAGAEGTDKLWRRYIIPLILISFAILTKHNAWYLFLFCISIPFSIGYGIPDSTDKGSTLGDFYYRLFKDKNLTERKLLSDIFTRGTIGLLVGISAVIIPIIKGNWILYILSCIGIIFTYILFGAVIKNEGIFNIFGKKLLLEEFYIYILITLLILIQI